MPLGGLVGKQKDTHPPTAATASASSLHPLLTPAGREPAPSQDTAQLPAHIPNFQWFDHRGQNFGQGALLMAGEQR